MSWKHIVIEGHCFLENQEESDIPKCCIDKPGTVGFHCLEYENGKYCPFFTFGKAPATVIVTDENGEDFQCDQFWDELNQEEKVWLKKEKDWIKKWAKMINMNKQTS